MKRTILAAVFALLATPAFAQTQPEAAIAATAQNVMAKMNPQLTRACGDSAAMNRVMATYHDQLKNRYNDYVDVVLIEEKIKDATGIDISFGYYEAWNDWWLSKYDHEDMAKARANFCAKSGQ